MMKSSNRTKPYTDELQGRQDGPLTMRKFAVKHSISALFLLLGLVQMSGCAPVRDEYFDDGKLKMRSTYIRSSGTLHGPQYTYAPTGHLRSISYYVENKKVGRECIYYETGGLFEVYEWARPSFSDPSFRLWGNEPYLEKKTKYYQNSKAYPGRSLILCTVVDEWLSQPSEKTLFVHGKPSIYRTFNTANELTAEFAYGSDGKPIRQR